MDEEEFELNWEEVSGRVDLHGEPDPRQRFRIYRVPTTDTEPQLLATGESEGDVGEAICTMAREGMFDDCALGIIDTMGEKGSRWLVTPWLPKV